MSAPAPATPAGANAATTPASHSSLASLQQQTRKKRVASAVTCSIGKHFGRTVDTRTSISAIADNAVLCLEHQDTEGPNPYRNTWLWTAYEALRARYGSELDSELLNDNPAWEFRNSFCQSIQKGRAQGRTDDIAVLKVRVRQWPPFNALGSGHSPGWSTDPYATMLKTPDLDFELDPDLRADLNSDIRDAPSNQFFAGLYDGYVFPGPGDHPCKGLFTSELFINTMKVIFLGPSSIQRPLSAVGRRSKSMKNNMNQVTIPTIAYCAMLLRFALHQAPTWYTIENDSDARFNYFAFYSETIDFLEEEGLVAFKNDLIERLNNLIFPRSARHHTLAGPAAQSSRVRALAAMQAQLP